MTSGEASRITSLLLQLPSTGVMVVDRLPARNGMFSFSPAPPVAAAPLLLLFTMTQLLPLELLPLLLLCRPSRDRSVRTRTCRSECVPDALEGNADDDDDDDDVVVLVIVAGSNFGGCINGCLPAEQSPLPTDSMCTS